LLIPTIITGCKFLSVSKKANPERRRIVQKPASVYNTFRMLLWTWTSVVYSTIAAFAWNNKSNKFTYYYNSDRNKGLNNYIFAFILVALFAVYNILLVPIVRILKNGIF
jgi:hypothetical protein